MLGSLYAAGAPTCCQHARGRHQPKFAGPFQASCTAPQLHRQFGSSCCGQRRGRASSRQIGFNVHAVAHGEASELVAQGQQKYDAGDRKGALRLFEQALRKDPSLKERQAALFNSTCVHAGNGDVEFAQVTLRDAINCGLDFESAMQNGDYVQLKSSPQVMIQLRKFAQASKRIKEAVGTEASAPQLAKAVSQGAIKPGDLADILNTEIKGGMDTSAFGILRRVLLIILVAIFSGTALFFLGLKYAFPEYR